jgi:hypothetical protein
MACKEVKETIDGVEYFTTQFPARFGLQIYTKLLAVFGTLLDSINSNELEMSNVNIRAFVDKLSEIGTIDLIIKTLSYTKKNGKDIDESSFDDDFAGEYLHLLKVVWFVVKANNFLGKGNTGNILEKIKQLFPKTKNNQTKETTEVSTKS